MEKMLSSDTYTNKNSSYNFYSELNSTHYYSFSFLIITPHMATVIISILLMKKLKFIDAM
jgi:hypothetical protein